MNACKVILFALGLLCSAAAPAPGQHAHPPGPPAPAPAAPPEDLDALKGLSLEAVRREGKTREIPPGAIEIPPGSDTAWGFASERWRTGSFRKRSASSAASSPTRRESRSSPRGLAAGSRRCTPTLPAAPCGEGRRCFRSTARSSSPPRRNTCSPCGPSRSGVGALSPSSPSPEKSSPRPPGGASCSGTSPRRKSAALRSGVLPRPRSPAQPFRRVHPRKAGRSRPVRGSGGGAFPDRRLVGRLADRRHLRVRAPRAAAGTRSRGKAFGCAGGAPHRPGRVPLPDPRPPDMHGARALHAAQPARPAQAGDVHRGRNRRLARRAPRRA